MKVEIEIFTLAEQEPRQDERVMVWKEKWRGWCPQVFNKKCDCWDDEEGDDYDCDLDPQDLWFSLPKNPNKL